jgi:hypothetical protein
MSEQGGDTRIELMFRLEAALKRIEALEAALRNILEARDDNQPAALNMPDLQYARAIIRIIHRHARDVLASGTK